MAKVYYESDGDLGVLLGRKIAIIGYGSQGHAHALSLRDSGADVTVGLRPGSEGWKRAESHGVTPVTPQEAVQDADVIGIFVPDHVQREVWDSVIAPALKPGMTVLFAHGFCIHFGQIVPPKDVNVIMVAPKGPGHLVRRLYTEGAGVPALIAIEQDPSGNARATALAWAIGIGAARAGRARDDVPRGDGVRPLRRAGRALRRRLGARAGRLRDAGRGRLRARRSPTSSASTSSS